MASGFWASQLSQTFINTHTPLDSALSITSILKNAVNFDSDQRTWHISILVCKPKNRDGKVGEEENVVIDSVWSDFPKRPLCIGH